MYDEDHTANAGDEIGTKKVNNGTVSHMVEWNAGGSSTSPMLDDINEALTTNRSKNIEEEPKYAQVKLKRNFILSK